MNVKESVPGNAGFLDKVLSRLGRLDGESLQTVVRRLERERRFLEALFNTIEDGVLVADPEGKIVYLNQAVTRLIGLQADRAEGEMVTRFLPGLDWSRATEMDRNGGRGVFRQEIEVRYPEPRFLRIYTAPLDGEAVGSAGLALILHDATEARQQTTEIIESERLHALTLLAGSVAHEIGNPLNAIHIHLQLIARATKKLQTRPGTASNSRARNTTKIDAVPLDEITELATKIDGYTRVCLGEITRLDYIITEFLQAMRPTPPKLQIASLNSVVEETFDLLRPEIENRGIVLRDGLSKPLPEIQVDPTQIKQVLVNLIKNALQAMTRGGTLTVSTGSNEREVWMTIADTGSGIAPELQRRIFEPFYTTKKKGTGLGLMIVERIMREHGGRIDLQSEVGRGTTFRLCFPLRLQLDYRNATQLPPG